MLGSLLRSPTRTRAPQQSPGLLLSLCDCPFQIFFSMPKQKAPLRMLLFWWRWRDLNSRPELSCQGFYECSLSFQNPFTYRRQTACKLRYSLLPDESRENQSFMFAAKSTLCPQARQSAGERKLLITQQEQLNYFCQLILSCYF